MADHIFRYQAFFIDKSQPLGHGSYGAVYKARCDQLPCAAKVLHPTILDPTDPGTGKIKERFLQECVFLKHIQHPNIVQYLNVTSDPESGVPVLLMELLDESLTKMLERSQQSLAYCIEVDICHDIALAVAYLHSNGIIHRDLSSNNVLITAGRRAKVTDFGMSKLAGAASPLTMCPGTLVYMPPEALDEPPEYTKKLDCFSEGVIMIQVCIRLWPEPGPRIQTISDSRSPTGVIQVPILEVNRRKNHIDMIDCSHGLLPIAVDCLHYQENERPSSEELCQRLADLKETREYKESVEKANGLQNDIAELEKQMGELQLKFHEEVLLQLNESLAKDVQVVELKKQLQQLNQQLGEQEEVTAEVELAKHSLQKQVEQLQWQLSQQTQQIKKFRLKKASTIEQLHEEIFQQQNKIQTKDEHIEELKKQLQQSSQCLDEQERLTTEVQLANDSLLGQVEQLQRQLHQQILQSKELQFRETAKIKQLRGEILLQQSEKDVSVEELKLQLQQSNQHLAEQERLTIGVQQANHSLQGQVEQLQRQLSQQTQQSETPSLYAPLQAQGQHQQDNSTKEKQSQPSPLHVAHHQNPDPPKRQLILGEWRDGGNVPFEMAKGHAVVALNVAYFMNFDGKGCSYDSLTKLWSKLPGCPNMYTGLVIIRGLLTAIGGGKGLYHPDPENNLLSLKHKKWVKQFPAMPTKRYSAAAVTMGQHLIVAGGQAGMSSYVSTVEVMDTQTLVWSTVANLPPSTFWASAIVSGGRFYMLGGYDKSDNTTSMLSCSLEKLLHSCSETSCDSVWQRITDVPVHLSTCAAVDEDLVMVGGRNEKKEASAAVYKYNPTTDSWDLISCMPAGRYDCLVALLPTNEIFVVGGYTPPTFTVTDKVEIATITHQT